MQAGSMVTRVLIEGPQSAAITVCVCWGGGGINKNSLSSIESGLVTLCYSTNHLCLLKYQLSKYGA